MVDVYGLHIYQTNFEWSDTQLATLAISDDLNNDVLEELMEFEMKKVKGEPVDGVTAYLNQLVAKYESKGLTFGAARNRYYGQVRGMFDDDIFPAKNDNDEVITNSDDEENEPETTTIGDSLPKEVKAKLRLVEKTPVEDKKEPSSSPEPPKPKTYDLDASIENFSNSHNVKDIPSKKVKYLPGHRVTVKVLSVRPYGALVETTSDDRTQGLIHISQVKDHYIDDVSKYFGIDDVIEDVKILKIEKDGKLNLSTKDTRLPMKVKEETKLTPPVVNPEEFKPLAEMVNQYANAYSSTPVLNTLSSEDNDWKDDEGIDADLLDMMEFIKGQVGAISPQAEELLKEIKAKQSTFNLSRAIFEVEKSFEPDLGLLYMQQVKKRLDEGL